MPIFNRIHSSLSSTQADVDPHNWKLSLSYSNPKSGSQTTIVPSLSVFRNIFIPSVPPAGVTLNNSDYLLAYPDISHPAVHLCLLECFHKLKRSAEAYGNTLQKPPAYEEKTCNAGLRSSQASNATNWDSVIELAVTRFTTWWMNIDQVFRHAAAYTHHAGKKSVVQLTQDYLPPIDVLLVWYAFMLDDVEYSRACREHGVPGLLHLCFPWPAIHNVIEHEGMTFTLSKAASNLFSTLSGQSADILTYLSSPPAYTETTTSPFPLDLASRVKEVDRFVDHAHELLWIRSPALKGSLERSLQAYADIHFENETHSNLVTPEHLFGVELTRRTHQLYPAHYRCFLEMTGNQASERDQLVESDSLKDVKTDPRREPPGTSQQKLKYSTQTDWCCCWTCERIRDDLPSYFRPCDTSIAGITPAEPSPSIQTTTSLASLSASQLRSIQDDLGFHHAVERARQTGQPLPTRPPTAAEKQAEKELAKKKEAAGILPSLGYYVVTTKSGKQKVKRHKNTSMIYGMGFAI